MKAQLPYDDFLRRKLPAIQSDGFSVSESEISRALKPHQSDVVRWALRQGRGLIASSFGLGKTRIQCEIARHVHNKTRRPFLIICPLGVKHQFVHEDGPIMGQQWTYIRNMEEYNTAIEKSPYVITNYERVRDGELDPRKMNLGGASLDEGSVLRSLGSDTQQTFEHVFADVKYKWVATATPSPNSYMELLNYAQFFGIEKRSNLLTKYFKRNPDKAGDLRLNESTERQFWLWTAGWALFIYKPSDLGHNDDGYILPKLNIHWHRVAVDQTRAFGQIDGLRKIKHNDGSVFEYGQRRMFLDATAGVSASAEERRETLQERLDTAKKIMAENPGKHFLLWHHLENERHAIEKQIPGAVTVYGSQDIDEREKSILDFIHGKIEILATKPSVAGSGCNFQHYCSDAIFIGVDYKFQDFIQAIHRIYRFLQKEEVNIHIIYAESQDKIIEVLKRKWAEHDRLVENMRQIVHEYGLISESLGKGLAMSIGVPREEYKGKLFDMIYNDCVLETQNMPDNSIDMILTSIPFSKHYSYVPEQGAYNDMGHNESDAAFWEQMDYIIPQLYRILKPGRICAVHVKDLIHYGHATDSGFMEIYYFSDDCNYAFRKHGFMTTGRITGVTDVVRENNTTNRLGWTEACKDMTKMGVGLPEYVLLFRKPPSDDTNQRADNPVQHDKAEYTRARWQLDAHSFWKSNGNGLLYPDELYDYMAHVERLEEREEAGQLSASFLMEPPVSPSSWVWDDIQFMRTLNASQSRARVENHVCPFPFDYCDRLIERFTNPGELVFDPFGGIGTTPYRALLKGRRAIATELNHEYFECAVRYCKDAEQQMLAPTLFDLMQYTVSNV